MLGAFIQGFQVEGRHFAGSSLDCFLAVGTLFLLPVILMYTGWSYWVFRGKVRAEIGYH